MATDELRPVNGFEGIYSVTRDGKVWSHARPARGPYGSTRTVGGRWLKPVPLNGYLRVFFPSGDQVLTVLAHRLVAEAWGTANDRTGPHINHMNGVKTDNYPENLEWCDASYNAKHAYAIGLYKPATPALRASTRRNGRANRRLTPEQVVSMRQERAAGAKASVLAAKYHLSMDATYKIIRRSTYPEI